MAARRELGFYSTLSSVSSVDIWGDLDNKVQGKKAKGPFYEVERLISKRRKREEVSFFDIRDAVTLL